MREAPQTDYTSGVRSPFESGHLSLAKAKQLAGKGNGRVFDQPVWLYDARRLAMEHKHWLWLQQILDAKWDLEWLLFWYDPIRERWEALQECGTLGGWPYFKCVGYLSDDLSDQIYREPGASLDRK